MHDSRLATTSACRATRDKWGRKYTRPAGCEKRIRDRHTIYRVSQIGETGYTRFASGAHAMRTGSHGNTGSRALGDEDFRASGGSAVPPRHRNMPLEGVGRQFPNDPFAAAVAAETDQPLVLTPVEALERGTESALGVLPGLRRQGIIDRRRPSLFLEGPQNRSYELWNSIKIFRELIYGFRKLHFVGPCVTVFGSARFDEKHPYYRQARLIGRLPPISSPDAQSHVVHVVPALSRCQSATPW